MVGKKLGYPVIAILFFVSVYFSYAFFSGGKAFGIKSSIVSNYSAPKGNGTASQETTTVDNEPKTEVCPLNGEMLSKTQKTKWEKRRPLGVMIENHKEARPQSGLSSADIIYEAVAEGGITRFLSIFYCKDAAYIGPVRSARIYFVKLLQEYGSNPLYAHVGGANTPGPANALGEIEDIEWSLYNDMNQFSVPFPYYWRDYERLPGRVTEHTVYSSTTKLWQYASSKRNLTNVDDKGVSWDKNFVSWKFKDDGKVSEIGNVGKISFGFWNSFASDYAVEWLYDKTTNSYKRNNGGSPHLDKNTGKPLSAKNIVVLFAKESPANDGYEGGHILYKLTGQGEGTLFQNGQATEISWSKKDEETRMKFYDNKDQEISFVRGQIFFEILPEGNKVNY